MKTLILVTLSLALSINSFAQTSNKPKLQPQTLQGNGGPGGVKPKTPSPGDGNGGPGGNTFVDKPATALTVWGYVKDEPKFKTTLAAAVRKMQYTFIAERTGWPLLEKALSKLFSVKKNGKDVYQVIKSVRFNVLLKGLCVDTDGKEKDGAANLRTNEICLSGEGIASKSNEYNLPEKVYALAIHEVSHFMGVTDTPQGNPPRSEADVLQEHAERGMPNILSGLSSGIYDFNMYTKDLLDQLSRIKEVLDSGADDATLCGFLGQLLAQQGYFSEAFQQIMAYGTEILPLHEAALVSMGIGSEMYLTQSSFCIKKPYWTGFDQGQYERPSYARLGRFIQPKGYSDLLGDTQIKIMDAGNRIDLREDLGIITQQLIDIRNSIPVSPTGDKK